MTTKPLPTATAISSTYWDALRQHKVMIQRCDHCGGWVFYPRSHCSHCWSDKLSWKEVSGAGTLYSYTIARVPTLAEFADEMPQILAVVELEEGLRVNTTLVGMAPEDISIGMKVVPYFDDSAEKTLLRFSRG